ncbi:hypothetical protein EI693_05350 [Pseudomonas oryziphila]|uniref:DUF1534 domain-containing protein n=1 Tax=Pseudomonas oryziphila TaxID=2894079 RepID=A0ABM7CMF5_9PSED|nr:hypothetical protein EI693_05350 [Pseudomonas oryziphila]
MQDHGRILGKVRHGAAPCRSGLVSRKGCAAAPAIHALTLRTWGRFAALSRHKAAPTEGAVLVAYWISPNSRASAL